MDFNERLEAAASAAGEDTRQRERRDLAARFLAGDKSIDLYAVGSEGVYEQSRTVIRGALRIADALIEESETT